MKPTGQPQEGLDERAARFQRSRELEDAKKRFRDNGVRLAQNTYIQLGAALANKAKVLAERHGQLSGLKVTAHSDCRILQGLRSRFLVLDWYCHFNNSLDESVLTVSLTTGVPSGIPGLMSCSEGKLLRTIKLDCELLALESDCPGYVERGSKKAYSIDELADYLLVVYMDSAEEAGGFAH